MTASLSAYRMKLKNLSLVNFRQFKKKTIEFDNHWTVIVAPNARGKSTLVEAIFMLSTGDSPWTNNNSNVIRYDTDSEDQYDKILSGTCRLEAEVENAEDVSNIALFFQNRGASVSKQFKIEGSPTTRNKFTQKLHCILFSPDLIDKLMFEPRQRRDFLDSYISQLNPDYLNILLNYEKVLRQRNSLLKAISGRKFRTGNCRDHEADDTQLEYWTKQLLDLGTSVMISRIEFINTLNETKNKLYPTLINYEPNVELSSLEELATEDHIKELFEAKLEDRHDKEILIGLTLVGPHRDDWHISSADKNLNIYGSRGEKRMGIADIIFKINQYLREQLGEFPVLLLDDVSSELDDRNIKKLFETKLDAKQQTIITTTHLNSLPEKVRGSAQIIEL